MGVHRNLSRGVTVDISLILYQVANDEMQMDLYKTFTLSTPQRKFPMKARTPFVFLKIVFWWSCMPVF